MSLTYKGQTMEQVEYYHVRLDEYNSHLQELQNELDSLDSYESETDEDYDSVEVRKDYLNNLISKTEDKICDLEDAIRELEDSEDADAEDVDDEVS
jgi:peptidoglycan hydrolase CwlO-like protein